ncbi:MAG TPA: CBS domain-containing protein [Dehalococcoidia bacterium]|nr:CBS domain-containing protein [Dehalococcoidia bacterium]
MTKNVIAVPANTILTHARDIMKAHNIHHLPVVDDNRKLLGMVNWDRLEEFFYTRFNPFASIRWQLLWLVVKTRLKDIMKRDVPTVGPDDTAERALALLESRQLRALPVVEHGKLVGIVTTSDLFNNIVSQVFTLDKSGQGIVVYEAGDGRSAEKVISCINELGIEIKRLATIAPPGAKRGDILIQLGVEDATQVVERLRALGFRAGLRPR